jgi:hypothetical protein
VAVPVLANAVPGVVVTVATSASIGSLTFPTVGDVLVFQILQDGTGADLTLTSTNAEDLAGAAGALTHIGSFQVGNPAAARQHLWIGRAVGDNMTASFTCASGDDWYGRMYHFQGVHTGTTLADVIEHAAGTVRTEAGTSTTVADAGIITNGPDRLVCNFVAINDDGTGFAAFTGETGGTWALPVAIFESATGTDGTIALVTATMASAGTIDGGSDAITSDAWGVVGFALKPVVAAAPGLARPNLSLRYQHLIVR